MSAVQSEFDHIRAFRDAMDAAGLKFSGEIEPDGKLHRFRVDGDRGDRRNGFYVLHLDGRPAGSFGSWKGVDTQKWTAEGTRPLTPEERRALAEQSRQRREAREAARRAEEANAARQAVAMWEAATVATDHPYLRRKEISGFGLRVGTWTKEWADKETGELRTKRFSNVLLVPMLDERKAIVGLQAIYAEPITWGGEKRGKDFIFGARKQGCRAVLGAPTKVDGVTTILLGEGYATCATAHAATGLGVIVCFDAGNLIHVASWVRKMMPDARLIFLADNDQWTTKADGTPWNPGVEKATAAAKEVGGEVAVPWFKDVSAKPTDYNDLQLLAGLEEVARQIGMVVSPPPAQAAAADPDIGPPDYDDVPDGPGPGENLPAESGDEERDFGHFFKVRGFDRENIYVYQCERKMIYARGHADWSEAAFRAIAPQHVWELEFPKKEGFDAKAAHNWIVRQSTAAGFFDPSSIRGRGAWRDDGRVVFHFGDALAVDGQMMPVTKIDSTFIYEQGKKLRRPSEVTLTKQDGAKILSLAKMFSWQRPASALLLSGWAALAPLCGALSWRPHIWITGGAGSGKTTIMNEFVHRLMNGSCLYAQGNSTEAGIRQALKLDALAILFDESEQNTQGERMRVQNVLSLLRQASSESHARTYKGTQSGEHSDFIIRSMACLSSIQVGIEQQADVERISVLALRSKRESKNAAGDWQALSSALAEFRRDVDLPARLMRRALEMLPITLQNIEVFAEAAAEEFGSQRDGDQYGAMLAGAWSLIRDKVASKDEAKALIKEYDWTDYTADSEQEGSIKALGALMGARVRVDGNVEATIYELVAAAAWKPEEHGYKPDADKADGMLKRIGMRVKWSGPMHRGGVHQPQNAVLLVRNNCEELKRIMERTPYAADLKGQLLRVPGASAHKPEKFLGQTDRCVAIPIGFILDGVEVATAADIADDDIAF